jgi:hypothetical protein
MLVPGIHTNTPVREIYFFPKYVTGECGSTVKTIEGWFVFK